MGALSADADESVIQRALLDQQLHRALLDQLNEGVCMLNGDHRIISSRIRSASAASSEREQRLSASTLDGWGDRLGVTVSVGGAIAEPGDGIESLEERMDQVYEGCRAGGSDRRAVAHLIGIGVSG